MTEQLRPATDQGGPYAHQPVAGICRVCKATGDLLTTTGCPAEAAYDDDGQRLTDARRFEQSARAWWRELRD